MALSLTSCLSANELKAHLSPACCSSHWYDFTDEDTMFQRLKGAIDSRIAEEQARQRSYQAPPTRSNSGAKKPSSRASSPSVKTYRGKQQIDRKEGDIPVKGPDPSEFDPEFVIGDENAASRNENPRPPTEETQDESSHDSTNEKPKLDNESHGQEQNTEEKDIAANLELPTDVRVKLRKLEKLESRYNELLRSYRIAHARVSAIEPFETTLRENTPLTSINDPGALIEYLNQLNLKGDMVLNEFKRVTSERDSFKERLDFAEKDAKEAWDSATKLREHQAASGKIDESVSGDESKSSNGIQRDHSILVQSTIPDASQVKLESPPALYEPQNTSAFPLSSPRKTPAQPPKKDEEVEEFFSYESELPRLENELKMKEADVIELQGQVKSMKDDLAVARESAQGMVKTLEDSTRELNLLKERKEEHEADLQEHKKTSDAAINSLRTDLEVAEGKLRKVEVIHNRRNDEKILQLEQSLRDTNLRLENMQELRAEKSKVDATVERLRNDVNSLNLELSNVQTQKDQSQKRVDTLNGLLTSLREQLSSTEQDGQRLKSELAESFERVKNLQERMMKAERKGVIQEGAANETDNAILNDVDPLETTNKDSDSKVGDSNVTNKKKNKKKKKGGKIVVEHERTAQSDQSESIQATGNRAAEKGTPARAEQSDTITRLQGELDNLRNLLLDKDAAIERLDRKLKSEEELKEEIESLRDELLEIGQEHVIAKERIKELVTEKSALQSTASNLEEEITRLRTNHLSRTADSDRAQEDLTAQFEDLKIKASSLQIDLSVAQQLASSRFKEITDMKTILQKAQPELISLRKEATELRGVKEKLDAKAGSLQQLETLQETMRTELENLRDATAGKDSDLKALNLKLNQETHNRLSIEEANSTMKQKLQESEAEKNQANQFLEKFTKDLNKSREDLVAARTRTSELDESVAKLIRDGESLKEEIDLKTAQYASAESLMSSMRDQSTEMAMQAKEARERCESLEEELAEAHRLLSERSREAETMRRLLAEVESRTDSRLREMKDRMDMAIEERDRAEEEVSTVGRRRTRELEELKNKLKDVDRNLKRSEEDKESLEIAQRDWKRRREDLERRNEQSSREVDELKKAMSELRDALDESEGQASNLEKQKVELRRTVEETHHKLDKLQKSNKAMADEVRSMQSAKAKVVHSEVPSSRSSLETAPSRAKMGSPPPNSKASSVTSKDAQDGPTLGAMDYVYLKNVLLQFLEQRDKKHQMQLIPVLGMLLHFDRKDEQKWMAAITTK